MTVSVAATEWEPVESAQRVAVRFLRSPNPQWGQTMRETLETWFPSDVRLFGLFYFGATALLTACALHGYNGAGGSLPSWLIF